MIKGKECSMPMISVFDKSMKKVLNFKINSELKTISSKFSSMNGLWKRKKIQMKNHWKKNYFFG